MQRIKVGGLPLILTFLEIVSTKVLSHFQLEDGGNLVSKQVTFSSTFPTFSTQKASHVPIFLRVALNSFAI